jgi:hypothetical protein
MKPTPRFKKPSKEPVVPLAKMTCTELAKWVKTVDRSLNHPDRNIKIIKRYSHPENMELLRLCGSLKASHHAQHCKTAACLKKVPVIQIAVAKGRPNKIPMPTYTYNLKRLATINGIVIHRWGRGAFILAHPSEDKARALRAGDDF